MRRLLLLAALALPVAALAQPVQQAHSTLFQHGRIYTLGPQGTISNGDVLIQNGKITAVGQNIAAPPGATIIDAKGKPVSVAEAKEQRAAKGKTATRKAETEEEPEERPARRRKSA